jgi:putative MATE family efflux protein
MSIIQAVGFFFGHGSGNYISRKLGARQSRDAEQMSAIGFFSAFAGGCLIMITGLLFLEPLARFLGATETVLPYAVQYMSIILIGAPFMTASLVVNNQLRFQGNALFAMFGIGTGAVLNIGLDPLLIFCFNMGIRGAALGTVISQFISFCILLMGCARSSSVTIRARNFRPSMEKYLAVVQGGLPSLSRNALACFAVIVLNRAAGQYGDSALAAMSIVQRFSFMIFAAMFGLGQGFQPVCGFNYGAKLFRRVKRAFLFCVAVSTGGLTIAMVGGMIFAPQIISFFCRNDAAVSRIGIETMRIQWISFPLGGFTVISNMMLENINRYAQATVTAMARQGLFLIPLLLVIPGFFGLPGIILCQPVSDFLAAVLTAILTLPVLRELS